MSQLAVSIQAPAMDPELLRALLEAPEVVEAARTLGAVASLLSRGQGTCVVMVGLKGPTFARASDVVDAAMRGTP